MSMPSIPSRPTTTGGTRAISPAAPLVTLLLTIAWLGAAFHVDAQTGGKPTGGKPKQEHEIQQAGEPPVIEAVLLPGKSTYIAVHEDSRTIPVRLRTRGRCAEGFRVAKAGLKLAGKSLAIPPQQGTEYSGRDYSGSAGKTWRTHQFDLDATQLRLWTGGKPLAENVPLPRQSAWQMCNEALVGHSNAERSRMLAEGFTLRRRSALTAEFAMQCSRFYTTKSGPFKEFDDPHLQTVESMAKGGVDITVKCLARPDPNAPRPTKKTSTTAAPSRKGKPMPPSIASVKLRAEIATHQACPDSVRLVGDITAGRAGKGIYLFVGNYWFSPKGDYGFRKAGDHRTVIATRKLNWTSHANDTIATAPGATRTQEGWVQLNVQPQGTSRLYTSERVPFKVVCKTPPARSKVSSAITFDKPAAATTMTAIAQPDSGTSNPAIGQATGKRQHLPLRARGHYDAATPGGATLALADLATIGDIRLGNKQAAWGSNRMSLDDTPGNEKTNNGRCRVPYRFEVINQGGAKAGGFVTRLRVGSEAVAESTSSGMTGDTRTVISGEAALMPGAQLIYVHIDDDRQVTEQDEKNNLRRIGVTVDCGS